MNEEDKDYQKTLEADYSDIYTKEEIKKLGLNKKDNNYMVYGLFILIALLILPFVNIQLFLMLVLLGVIGISCFAIFSGVSNVTKGVINRNTRYNEENDD